MDDYISRADAMGAVQDHFNANGFKGYDDGQKMMDRIKALPSADAEWIPCSERLPSESGDYLCTIPLDADETYTEVLTFHKGRFYEDDAEWGATFYDDVLAWMPLPKPYKGGEKTWLTGMKCSNCGKLFDLRVGYHYCPSCGARMKGGAE